MATADSGAVRSTSTMSGPRPATSSTPMTRTSPPITGIGISSASEPADAARAPSSTRPAKMPAQRVCAPADTATPVRDSDPPVGSAPKKPPARFAAPCATKSRDVLGRLPSGFGTAAEMPAACARPTSATASPPPSSPGIASKFGNTKGGKRIRNRRDVADGLDVDVQDDDGHGHDDERDQGRERLERLDEMEHHPHGDRRQRDQARRQLATTRRARRPRRTCRIVLWLCGRYPVDVDDHPGDDLHRDARGEARHHRVGDEVHDRAELQQPEDSIITTPTTSARAATFAGIGRVEAGRREHAA